MCKCSHRPPRVQLGVPLEEKDLEAMDPSKRKILESFLIQGKEELEAREKEERTQATPFPYEPSPSLQAKFEEAVVKCEALIYCPTQQLLELFSFKIPATPAS